MTSAPPGSASGRSWSVAVADDDPTLRQLLRMMLELEPDFDVVGDACDGREAVELIARVQCPDVLLLDLNMPRMDGYEVLREIKNLCPPLSIVVYSGEDTADARSKLCALGDFDYVEKGDPMRLIKKLREVCRKRDEFGLADAGR